MKKISPVFIISILILCLITAYSFSKYVIRISEIHIQSPKDFYFKSNVLTTDNKTYELYDWDGKSKYKISINLQNYEDELRITSEDIKYEFSAVCKTDGINMVISGEKEGTLTQNLKTEKQIEIDLNPLKSISKDEFIEVEIVAKSIEPYEKELSAIFKIYSQDVSLYETNLENIEDEDYAKLYITTRDLDVPLNITYDNTKVILDTNNELLQNTIITNSENKSKISVTLEKNSNYCIDFLKKDSNNTIILNTDIIVSE